MNSMKATFDKFARVSALRSAVRRAQPVHGERSVPGESAPFADDLTRLLGATCARNPYGEHLQMRQWFAEPAECGAPNGAMELLLPKRAGLKTGPCAGGGSAAGAADAAADPAKWLFLDTETTGLAGGTGTYAFLVGVAWWEAGGLQVEQFFMRDYTEEHSLLEALAARLRERPVLVTFNGKTFDWPLLETRYRMTRCIPAPEPAAHLDLLHPARALWRLRIGSVRLAEIERQVLARHGGLAWSRAADVRSEMIPHIYFQFLRGGSPDLLMDVLRHNVMDLRGLALLAGRVIGLLNDPEAAEADGHEWFGVARMTRRRAPGQAKRAQLGFERSREAGLPESLDLAALRELAVLARRERDHARAASLWEQIVGQTSRSVPEESIQIAHEKPGPADLGESTGALPLARGTGVDACPTLLIEACEQIAMHYEHRGRDRRRALEWTGDALATLRRAARAGLLPPEKQARLRARLERRRARLEGKGLTGPAAEREIPARI
jgi:hypothetical protein